MKREVVFQSGVERESDRVWAEIRCFNKRQKFELRRQALSLARPGQCSSKLSQSVKAVDVLICGLSIDCVSQGSGVLIFGCCAVESGDGLVKIYFTVPTSRGCHLTVTAQCMICFDMTYLFSQSYGITYLCTASLTVT